MPRRIIRKRRTYRRKRNNVSKLNKKVNYLCRMNKPEVKYFTNSYLAAGVDLNGSLNTSLVFPAQGLTASARVGDVIRVKNITIRGQWAYNGADSAVRMIVFYDYDNTIAGTINYLDQVATNNAVFSNRSQSYLYNAKTLLDKTTYVTADVALRTFQYKIRINQKTKYSPASTVVQKGAIKLLVITNELFNLPLFSYKVFATYTDA